jgi:hypothetical protein
MSVMGERTKAGGESEGLAAWRKTKRLSYLLLAIALPGALLVDYAAGLRDLRIMAIVAAVMLAVTVVVVPVVHGILRPKGDATPQRRDFNQWTRWRSCLYVWPFNLTLLAIVTATPMAWPRGEFGWIRYVMIGLLPFTVLGVFGQIIPWLWPRLAFTRRQREWIEDMEDDLSRDHAGRAFNLGAYGFVLGLAGVIAAALLAPQFVLQAAVAALWLGTVATSIRFGLLQRAAEEGER